MRILVYGMQSSGASLVTYFLAQREGSLAYLDLFRNQVIPKIPEQAKEEMILKCTISPEVSLDEQIENFTPNKLILVIRDPFTNYASLKVKPYSGSNQELAQKFNLLENTFTNSEIFDAIIHYEDFIFKPEFVASQLEKIGIKLPIAGHNFQRSMQDILSFTAEKSKRLGIKTNNRVGTGNIHTNSNNVIVAKELAFRWLSNKDKNLVRGLCPNLSNYYDDYLKEFSKPSDKILFLRSLKKLF